MHCNAKVIMLPLLITIASCFSAEDAKQTVSALQQSCGSEDLAAIRQNNTVSPDCREALRAILPDFKSTFDADKIYLLGQSAGTGEQGPAAYVIGPVADELVVTLSDGESESTLRIGSDMISSLAEETDLLLATSVLQDYSLSMADSDLDESELLFTDVFTVLPSIFEADVEYFSEDVDLMQTFARDKAEILSSFKRDDEYERGSTALYDAVGEALVRLRDREAPAKLLLVSTDGMENSSVRYTMEQIKQLRDDSSIVVVIIAAFLADTAELKELVGSRGFHFYAFDYKNIRQHLADFVASLGTISRIQLPVEYADRTIVGVER